MTSHVLLLSGSTPEPTFLKNLQAEGFSIEAETGLDAILRSAAEKPPAAIVIDSDSDQRLGFCRALRANDTVRNIPLLVVTAPVTAERKQALEAGASDLLSSPLEEIELMLRLRKLQDSTALNAAATENQWSGAMEILNHDLKSPLATIMTGMELLHELMSETLGSLSYLVSNALVAAKRQSFLIEDFLTFLLLEEREVTLKSRATHIDRVLSTLQIDTTPYVEKKGLKPITFQVEKNLPQIDADEALLLRALNALVDNALKFCTVENEIKVVAQQRSGQVVVLIMDNGRPIHTEYNERIFQLTHQAEARRKGSRSTVGVGLPFAQAALRLMDATLTVSTKKEWTTFTVGLKIAGTGTAP